ncbi:MAG: hypothetical protein KDE48_21270 [Anaerolineales bacterium]|nr:hypothetical protein [Anaerolineales bacterium]
MQQGTGSFSDILNAYIERSAYRPGQLARLTSVPQMTIVNWLEGRVKRPRAWQDVVRLAGALRLNLRETDTLLKAASYPPLTHLQRGSQDEREQALFTLWTAEQSLADKPAPFQMIPDLATFIGRDTLLGRLQELLLAEYHVEPYLLSGTVGIGKTALAVRLAYQLRPHFRDGVLWARLDTMPVMSILQLWAEAYGRDVSAYTDLDSRSTAIRELLATKQALIVLDNVHSNAQLQLLLPPSGTCAVLITSRRRDLTALPDGRRFDVESFTEAEAMALLARVLGEERVKREQAALEEIATLLGHHPLALDLVACRLAYEGGLQTAVLLEQLHDEKQRLALLTYGGQELYIALETAYSLLPLAVQHFFVSLGCDIHGLDFCVTEAAAVTGETLETAATYLRDLFCLSLLQRGHGDRYQLIPVLQDFARGKIGITPLG